MTTPHDKMILEPAALNIENGPVNQRMTESWKGPWSELKKLTDIKDSNIFGVKLYPGLPRPALSGEYWQAEFNVPVVSVPSENKQWIITDVQATQAAAGDYGVLRIQYETRGSTTSTSQSVEESTGIPENGEQRRPTTWTLTFQQLTRSPLAYADTSAVNTIQQCYSCQHPAQWSDISAQVAGYLPPVTSADLEYCYYAQMPSGEVYVNVLLGEKNRKIYKYLLAGVTPQFHLPIVSRDAYFSLSAGDAMGCHITDLDRVTSLPANCPYTWSGVQWLKTEDTFNVTQSNGAVVEYQRHTTWMASEHWDTNFYGVSAWTPVPYDSSNEQQNS